MKKLFVVLILAGLAVFSGCLLSSDNKKTDNGGGGGGTETAGFNTYLPYRLGSSWTYEETEYRPIYTLIETIIGTRSRDGKIYWMLEEWEEKLGYYDITTDTTLVRIEGNTVYEGAGDRPILKFGLSPLQTWIVWEISRSKYVGKYLGIEGAQVTVPAGSFSGCAKYEFFFEDIATEKSSKLAKTEPYYYHHRSTAWYAPNVGKVKETSESGNYKKVLISYTTP